MNEQELNNLLKAFDERITDNVILNRIVIDNLQTQKSVSALDKRRFWRIAELIFALAVQVFLGSFLYANRESASLVMSAAILMLFMILEIAGNIHQLILISRFDYNQSVTENQAVQPFCKPTSSAFCACWCCSRLSFWLTFWLASRSFLMWTSGRRQTKIGFWQTWFLACF